MRLVVLTLAICFSSSATSESNDVSTDDLAWLSGNWVGEHDGSVMEEVISKPNAGLMLGFSRIFNDGSTEFFEFMQFKDTENGLVFLPSPFGKPGVAFNVKSYNSNKIVFENEDNDFPSLISYERIGSEVLKAEISGIKDGETVVINFHFTKSK
jgi:hypothetical protein